MPDGGDDAVTVAADPSPARRARRVRPAAKPMKVPPKAKWLSVPIPTKYGGPTLYVFMPCALAGSVKETFNEDLMDAANQELSRSGGHQIVSDCWLFNPILQSH